MIYLDSAATSFLKPKSVKLAMLNAMSTMASPGRGAYTAAWKAADKVYECRELIGELFNFSDIERIAFTMNATHALNIAIRSLAEKGNKVLISGYEHNSVTRVLNDIGAKTVVLDTPLFDTEAVLKKAERSLDGVSFVVINHVSNVFGFEQPIYEIAKLCSSKGVPLIVDASQSAGACEIDAGKLGAAFIAMPGHKGLMGPQGTGVLLCGAEPKPLLFGGTGSESIVQTMPETLPDRIEAGTHNVVGIAGLAEGVKYVLNASSDRIGEYEKHLRRVVAASLRKIDGLEVFETGSDNQAGVLSFRHSSIDCETLCEAMSKRSIAARCGLHCAPLAHKTAGTLDTGTVRISFSPFISKKQVLNAVKIIENIIVTEN